MFSKVTHRAPKHKYTAQMSQVSKVEPLGVFPLDPASNHGEVSKQHLHQASYVLLRYDQMVHDC